MRRWGTTERVVGLHDPQVNEHHLESTGLPADNRLRLLSFNIQVGNSTEKYRHYITRGWQHLLPHNGRAGNPQKIGDLLVTSTWSPCRKPMVAAFARATSIRSSI